ncbi:MAG: hypothetical protein AB8G22_06855, partial [Saprospiraceae bacterium]
LLTKILRKLSSAEKEPHSQTEDNYHYILRNIEQHYKAGNRHLEISLSPIGVPAAAMLLHPEIGTQEEVIHLIKMYRKEGFYINQGK